eukprot:211434_1
MSASDNSDTDEMHDFDYLTDMCKDQTFSTQEMRLILRVIKLELQPLWYLFLFMKGIYLWLNIRFSFVTLCILLLIGYFDIVNYLFAIICIIMGLLMFAMKINPNDATTVLTLLVAMVWSIHYEDYREEEKKKSSGWNFVNKAFSIKQEIEQKLKQLGQIQYVLYQISIQIGRIRTICFYKNGNQYFSGSLCSSFIVLGILGFILPLRVYYIITVCSVFYIHNPLRKHPNKKIIKMAKAVFKSVHPDIPDLKPTKKI